LAALLVPYFLPCGARSFPPAMMEHAENTLGAFREASYTRELVSKLRSIGVATLDDLVATSREELEARTQNNPSFSLTEMADSVSLARGMRSASGRCSPREKRRPERRPSPRERRPERRTGQGDASPAADPADAACREGRGEIPGLKLFMGSLPAHVTQATLKAELGCYGEVREVKLLNANASSGLRAAFVFLHDRATGERIIKGLGGKGDDCLVVNWASDKRRELSVRPPSKDALPADVQMKREDDASTTASSSGRRRSRSPRNRGKGKGRGGAPKPSLWSAAEAGDAEQVRKLLEAGADPEERFEGWTPLMKAAEENHSGIIELLLAWRVDVNAANKKGRTALSFAAAPSRKGQQERPVAVDAIRVLMACKTIDLSKVDESGSTVLQRAEKEKREAAIHLLKSRR